MAYCDFNSYVRLEDKGEWERHDTPQNRVKADEYKKSRANAEKQNVMSQ